MPTLPKTHDSLIRIFAPCFSNLVWQHAQVLLIGAILVPGTRTVTAVLRIMGLSEERHFQTYHRVLNRAAWSSRALSQTLLLLLVKTFVPTGPIICGLDDTIERRRGPKIKARGIYRDPVRSSHDHCDRPLELHVVEVDDVDVAEHARLQHAAVAEAVERRGVGRHLVHDALERQPVVRAVAGPVREHERGRARVARGAAVRAAVAETPRAASGAAASRAPGRVRSPCS